MDNYTKKHYDEITLKPKSKRRKDKKDLRNKAKDRL